MRMKSVLLADDNAFILETIAARIRDDGIDVITAHNGQEAVERAKAVRPDLAILDVSMPVMNGLDAATRLHEMLPRLPIILFTSFADVLRNRITPTGVVAVFDKGSRLTDLISTVDECLRGKEKLG